MAGKLFLDTNVLIHANNVASPFCTPARNKISSVASSFDSIWIGRQTIREYLVVMTNLMRIAGKVNHESLLVDINNFLVSFDVADETDSVTQQLLKLVYDVGLIGKPIHDANIVALMLVNNIDTILTQNVTDFAPFSHLIQIEPLV